MHFVVQFCSVDQERLTKRPTEGCQQKKQGNKIIGEKRRTKIKNSSLWEYNTNTKSRPKWARRPPQATATLCEVQLHHKQWNMSSTCYNL